MADPDDRYLYDALYGERAEHVARDSNPQSEEEQLDALSFGTSFGTPVARAFATMPPPFPPDRHRPRTRSAAAQTTEIKNTIFNSYTQRLQDADGEWTDKTSLFVSAFEHLVPAASLEADVVLTDFTDYGSNVFEFESYECYNSMYEPVPLGDHPQFQPPERAAIRWFKFALTIAPQETNVGHLAVDAHMFPTRHTHTVYVRALLTQQGNLHPSITKTVLRNRASTLKDLYTAQGQTLEPAIKSTDSSYADPAKFNKILRQIKAETKFNAVKQIIAPVFVGRIDGLRSLTNRILAIDQSFTDPVTKTRRFSTVAEMNQKMQALLQEIDQTNPPADLPDLAKTFFQGLHDNIKHKVINQLPAGTPTTLGDNLRRYNDLVRNAIEAEEDQKRVAKLVQQTARNLQSQRPQNRNSSRAAGPRVFFAAQPETSHSPTPHTFATSHQPHEDEKNVYTTTPSGTRYLIPRVFCATHSGNHIAEEMIATSVEIVETLTDDPKPDGFAGVSIVEQALRNASGVRKPIKCFGCQGLAQYDNNAYHLWKDCPNKADQAVWRNFQTNLRRFREEKNRRREENRQYNPNNNYYGPNTATRTETTEPTESTTLANWQRQGFPTRAMGEKIEAIADPETKPAVRKALIATLKKDLINTDLNAADGDEFEAKPKGKKETQRSSIPPLHES